MAFKKGQSGNPKGRPKKTPDLVEIETLAREYTPEAIERLAHWMRSDDPAASVKASSILIDRAHGKAIQKQQINATVTNHMVMSPPPEKDADDWAAKNTPVH